MAEDYTELYNTALSDEDEVKFQKWAKESNKLGDLYDYDLRGAWLDMQSGDMAPDERGHLGDKYKKPNHPTFSNQSIYSSLMTPGGEWGEDSDGNTTFTPSPYTTENHYSNFELDTYFRQYEPEARLNISY